MPNSVKNGVCYVDEVGTVSGSPLEIKAIDFYPSAVSDSVSLKFWDECPANASGWSKRKKITLPVPDADLTDFPVCIKIVDDADIGAICLATGYDIRFTAADGVTLLSYERESFAVAGGEATGIFWVKTNVATAGTYIWLYYGNAAAPDGQNAEAVWDSSFKAIYHMKDATTSTILDSTANNNDGAKAAANEPIEATGKIEKGQDFDGANDWIKSIPDSFPQQPFTLSTWIYPHDVITDHQRIIGVRYDRINLETRLTAIRFGFYDGTDFRVIDLGAVLSVDTWFHVAVTKDATNGLKLYINGSLVSTNTDATAKLDVVFFDQITRIGAGETGLGVWAEFFNGLEDEVRVSSVVRSADWIAYEYANMNPADGGLTWGDEDNQALYPSRSFFNCLTPTATNTLESKHHYLGGVDVPNLICDGISAGSYAIIYTR